MAIMISLGSLRAALLGAALVASACSFPKYDFADLGADGSVADAGGADAPCTPNACGGCSTIEGKVGDKCGACGTLVCALSGDLVCEGDVKNACGSCGTLPMQPGDPCSSCGGGIVAECFEGTARCPGATNDCGGCSTLTDKRGAACTLPDGCAGKFECKTGDSVECRGPAKNLCGGCGVLGGVPGDKCPGICGELVCGADKVSLTCKQPTGLGGSCGIGCSDSKFVCGSTGKTAVCSNPSERTGTDATTPSSTRDDNGLCRWYKKAVSFSTGRRGRIEKIRLKLRRDACSSCGGCASTREGSVTVRLYEGSIGDTSKPRGAGSLTSSAISSSDPDEFTLTGTSVVDAGRTMWFSVETDSDTYQFAFSSVSTAPSGMKAEVNYGSAWEPGFTPVMYFQAEIFGCF